MSNNTAKPASTAPKNGALAREGDFWHEGIYGLGCGLVYGFTSAVVGQPLDSVKTKMQAQAQYMNMGMLRTASHVVKNEGVIGLFRGIVPPLIGASIFRSVQFGAYSFAWAGLGSSPYTQWAKEPLPMSGGLEPRVILGGIFSGSVRTMIECPLEVIKVRQMTGQPWAFRELFKGFGVLWLRATGLMTSFFVMVDYATKYIPEVITYPGIGPFIKGGVGSTLAWAIVWPFETLKNQIQANTEGPKTIGARLGWVLNNQGIRGLYRGFMPGASRSLIANGVSMLAFDKCQQLRPQHPQPNK